MTLPDAAPAPPMPAAIAALREGGEPVWLFAYGSLLWDPEFRDIAAEPALLRGYRRSFCVYSYDYRGSPGRPGLTLGLDRGGSCRGMVFRLPPDAITRVWEREMSGRPVYEARLLAVRTTNDIRKALAFTVLRDRPDYAGRLPPERKARLILEAVGRRGACRDYFETTLRRLDELGVVDRPLRRLAERVAALAALEDANAGV